MVELFVRYTRNLIDVGNGKFNLMALCWGESHGSSIHDHSNSHCFVKILEGELQETMYNWPSESDGETHMTAREVNRYKRDGVTYINGELYRLRTLKCGTKYSYHCVLFVPKYLSFFFPKPYFTPD
jgi:hypothetical protein